MDDWQFFQNRREILPAPGGVRRVLVILGQSRADGPGAALARAYAEGARRGGAEVRQFCLADLVTPPVTRPRRGVAGRSLRRSVSARRRASRTGTAPGAGAADPPQETERERSPLDTDELRRLVHWCQHLVLIHPAGWAGLTASFKVFLDRCLLSDREGSGSDPSRLAPGRERYQMFGGRTAEIITTLDTVRPARRWTRWTADGQGPAAFGYCGIETVRVTNFGPIDAATPEERGRWVDAARDLGSRLERGSRTDFQKALKTGGAWIAAMRPHLFLIALVAYGVGALGAAAADGLLVWPFLTGLAALTGLLVAAAFTKELFDFESDARSRNGGPLNGGSRVLVDGRLSRADLRRGAGVALVVAAYAAVALLWAGPAGSASAAGLVAGAMVLLVLGNVIPPFQFSRRGLGEANLALVQGFGAVMFGFLVQGGAWTAPFPWLMGLLATLALFPVLVLAGLPDRSADAASGKRTLAVRLGPARAAGLALAALVLASVGAAAGLGWASVAPATRGLVYLVIPHAALMAFMLVRHIDSGAPERRLDGLLTAGMLFAMWFVVLPVLNLY